MTKDKLMDVYYIQKEISSWEKELEEMRRPQQGSEAWGSIRRKKRKCNDSAIEKEAEALLIQHKIEEKLKELEQVKNEVMSYILNIEDCQTRLIFKLRCLNRLSWNAVADEVGGMNSEDSVKKRFYRYLEKCS